MLDGKLKTMLQSVDTARFRDADVADRLTDISHARSEILSAMLFGYEIVVPAGAVADCPALIELIPEVLADAKPYLEQIKRDIKQDYKLFRIGLEQKYQSLDGFSGYSAFVADYLSSKLGAAPTLVALSELVESSARDPLRVPEMLGKAYLERDWGAITLAGKDIARATGDTRAEEKFDNYSRYCQCVHQFLEPGEHSRYASRPLFSAGSFISNTDKTHYLDELYKLLDISQARDVQNKDLVNERKLVRRVYDEIVNMELNPAARGSWYSFENRFKDAGAWGYLRNWLDIILYDKLRTGFDVRIPSYFTQELDIHGNDLGMTLSLMPGSALSDFSESTKSGELVLEHADEFEVDWQAIWQIVSDKDYQVSLSAVTERYRDALMCERQELETLVTKDPKELGKQRIEIIKRRRVGMVAAFDDHLKFLNEKFTNFKLVNKNGKIIARRSQRVSAKKIVKTLLSVGTGAGPALDSWVDPLLDPLVDAFSNKAVDEVWARDIESPSNIDAVKRPRNIKVKDRESFITADRERINLWISS